MNPKIRSRIEETIAQAILNKLAEFGFIFSVYDGEEFVIRDSGNIDNVLKAMFGTDDDTIYVTHPQTNVHGHVQLVYGNGGTDVIHDYTTNLEQYISPAEELAEQIDDGEFVIISKRGM